MLKLAWRVWSFLIGEKEDRDSLPPYRSVMSSIPEAKSHSPKLPPDDIKGDAKRILPIPRAAGLFHATCCIAYSDVQERRKNTFPETEKVFLSSPSGVCQNLPKDKGEKGRVLECPRYPRDVMPDRGLGKVSMVHALHLSGYSGLIVPTRA